VSKSHDCEHHVSLFIRKKTGTQKILSKYQEEMSKKGEGGGKGENEKKEDRKCKFLNILGC
jgi:hypothetical protein